MELKSSIGPKHNKGDKSFLCFASTSTTTEYKHIQLLPGLSVDPGGGDGSTEGMGRVVRSEERGRGVKVPGEHQQPHHALSI